MANDNKGLTPMMRQFFEMKSKHPEALLLFRCGDFYETYCEDAVEASRILGITLTRRNNGGATGSIEMRDSLIMHSILTCLNSSGQESELPYATSWKTRRRNAWKSRARRD